MKYYFIILDECGREIERVELLTLGDALSAHKAFIRAYPWGGDYTYRFESSFSEA